MLLRSSLTLALVLLAAPAAAQIPPILPNPMRLEYKGPPEPACPDESYVRSAIKNQARTDPFSADAPVLLKVTVTRKKGMYGGHLEIRDAAGELVRNEEGKVLMDRELFPEAVCDTQILSLAFILGEKLRPLPKPPPPLPPPPPPPLPPRSVVIVVTRPDERLPRPTERARLVRIGASTALAIGSAPPGLAADLTVEGGLQWRRSEAWVLSADLGVRVSPSPSASLSGVHASTFQIAGVLAPCVHFHMFFGCAGVEVGGVVASMSDVGHPEIYTSSVPVWAALVPRLGLEQPLPHVPWLALRLFGEMPVTIHTVTLAVQQGPMGVERQLWKTPPVTGAVGFGAVLFL